MVKIMLVEDEPFVRKCLRETIDWASLDCEICGEAADGSEALELCEKTQPDIIITDIVMDMCNGLDMIDALRSRKYDVEIIILTGYDNFDYARRALANNVSAYILKPVQNQVIIDEVLKLKEKLKEKQRLSRAVSEYTSKNRNAFLEKLISAENLTPKKCAELAAGLDITLPSDNYCMAILLPDKAPKNSESSSRTEFAALREAVSYCISTSKFFSLYCETDENALLLMVFLNHRSEKNDVDAFFLDLQRHYCNITGSTLTIGVSGIFKNTVIVQRAVSQARKALARRAVLGRNRIIQYTEQQYESGEFAILTTEQINRIVSDIKSLKTQKARETVCKWLDSAQSCTSVDMELIKNNLLELVILILRSTVQSTHSMNSVFGRTVLPTAELLKIEYISELKVWISDIISCIEKHPNACMPYTYSPMVQKSVLYIRENYPSHITIEQLAAELYVSPRTLTRLFKKETGKTFSEYLTEYRVEAAVSLLQSGNYKTYEVATLVGYHDSKHFHKIFKKITGYSPGHYRRSDGADDED